MSTEQIVSEMSSQGVSAVDQLHECVGDELPNDAATRAAIAYAGSTLAGDGIRLLDVARYAGVSVDEVTRRLERVRAVAPITIPQASVPDLVDRYIDKLDAEDYIQTLTHRLIHQAGGVEGLANNRTVPAVAAGIIFLASRLEHSNQVSLRDLASVSGVTRPTIMNAADGVAESCGIKYAKSRQMRKADRESIRRELEEIHHSSERVPPVVLDQAEQLLEESTTEWWEGRTPTSAAAGLYYVAAHYYRVSIRLADVADWTGLLIGTVSESKDVVLEGLPPEIADTVQDNIPHGPGGT